MREQTAKTPLAGTDLSVCLVLMIGTSVVALFLRTELALSIIFGSLCLYLSLFGFRRSLLSYCIGYFILWGGLYLFREIPILGSTPLPLMTVYIRRLTLPAMAARPLASAPVGRLVVTFNRLRLPKVISLSLSILFRFMPTISDEYRHIRDAQKFRGMEYLLMSAIRHPFKTVEYTLIPMLIRTSKTADELSASAAVRGIRLKGKVSSFHQLQTGLRDWLVMSIGCCILIAVFMIDRIYAGR